MDTSCNICDSFIIFVEGTECIDRAKKKSERGYPEGFMRDQIEVHIKDFTEGD